MMDAKIADRFSKNFAWLQEFYEDTKSLFDIVEQRLKEKEKEGEVYEKLRMFTEAANVFVQEARQRKSAGESEKAVELFIKAGKNFESADVFMRALNSYIEAGRNDLAFAYAKKETKSESERLFRLSMVKRQAEQKQQEAFQAGRMRR